MEYLNKVELRGITDGHARETAGELLSTTDFRVITEREYTNVKGEPTVDVNYIHVHVLSTKGSPLEGFVFKPHTPVHVIGRLEWIKPRAGESILAVIPTNIEYTKED